MSLIEPQTDPNEAIAPSEAEWAALTPAERERIVRSLGIHVEHDFMSEGDAHAAVVIDAADAMRNHFGSGGPGGRRFYIGRSVMVHYPKKRGFAPDLFVVFDVEDHPRNSWVVSKEGRGLDLAVEVLNEGDVGKDYRRNVELYAEVGIPEYFILDIPKQKVTGYRLRPGERTYRPILGQSGRLLSEVLGLWIGLLDGRFRLFYQQAVLPTTSELMARMAVELERTQEIAATEAANAAELTARLQAQAEQTRSEAERADAEAERARAEAERAEVEAERARAEAERADASEAARVALEARVQALIEELARRPAVGQRAD